MKFEGKTIIELHDAKTGRLAKRTEDKNMLTNALTQFYAQGGMSNPSAFGASGIRTDAMINLLGGVLLLDDELDEDASIVRVPAGVHMTANGSYGILNSGNPPELGSWNENESGWTNDGAYKFVYDWTTSQGNGTVACVCLSSKYGGHQGIGNASDTWANDAQDISGYNAITSITTGGAQALGFYNNTYFAINEGSINGLTEVTIKEYALPVSEIDVRDKVAGREKASYTKALPSTLQNLSGGAWAIRALFCKGKIAHMLFGQLNNYQFGGGSLNPTIYYVTFDMDTKTFGSVVTLTASATYVNGIGVSDTHAILNNKMINLANTVDVSDISDTIGALSDGGGFVGNRKTYETVDSKIFYGNFYQDSTKAYRIDLQDKAVKFVNGQDHIDGSIGASVNGLLRVFPNYVVRDPRYIATINNLEEPVTKDASKTMKVTYVIRFS